MFLDARSCQVAVDGDTIEYIVFGSGKMPLIILPGLSDGLRPAHGTLAAMSLAHSFRHYGKCFRVYLFSRRNHLPQGYTTRDMARDQADAMKALGIEWADVLGVSQGGAIAQHLALDFPAMVHRLVLAVTYSQKSEILQKAVSGWMDMARRGDYQALVADTTERSYSEKALRKYRPLYPLLGRIGKPDDFERFLISAEACLTHDTHAELKKIHCPTLIIGGGDDQIVGAHAAQDLAHRIKGSKLFIYKGLGHAAYDEAADFHTRVLKFLLR